MLPRRIEEITKWKRLFLIASSAFAMVESQPIPANTPTSRQELTQEATALSAELNVYHLLRTWRLAIHDIGAERRNSHYLLELDPDKKTLIVEGFQEADYLAAYSRYIHAEEEIGRDAPSTNVVLVSVRSVGELRSAYPNYYGDTEAFIAALQHFTSDQSAGQI